MSILAYDASHSVAEHEAAPRRNLWRRILEALIASRAMQAEQVIGRHRYLLVPRELDQAGWKTESRSEDSLPFVK